MKICIVGAGATGGHLAVKLQAAGHDVSVIARGAQLEAIRANGVTLEGQGEAQVARVRAAADATELGVQDLVFVATKATALAQIAPQLPALVGSHTSVAFLQNGMTWWYPIGLPADRPPPPDLAVFRLTETYLKIMRPEQVLAGTVYSANAVVRPGVVQNNSPRKNGIELVNITEDETDGLRQARIALSGSGVEALPVTDARASLWLKLVGNAAMSSLCVATGNPAAIVYDPAIQEVFTRMLNDCLEVAAAHGYPVADQVDLSRWTKHRAQHKPSMLQDFEAGRPMEVAEMVLAPVAFARAAGLQTPTLDAVAAVAARLAMDKGLYTAEA